MKLTTEQYIKPNPDSNSDVDYVSDDEMKSFISGLFNGDKFYGTNLECPDASIVPDAEFASQEEVEDFPHGLFKKKPSEA